MYRSPFFSRASRSLIVGTLALCSFTAGRALAVEIGDYVPSRTFLLPEAGDGSGGNVFLDVRADGRAMTLNGDIFSLEDGVGLGTFTQVGAIAGFTPPSYGPSFFAISPDGTKAAAGNNGGSVYVFDTANPAAATTYNAGDFDGDWLDNSRLAISGFGGASAGVSVLNTASGIVSPVITNVGGASAGVTFDPAGNLYTGNGYDGPGASDTGWVKAFSATAVADAIASGTPIDFEAGGAAIVDVLSAASLGFDSAGNLLVGGADLYDDGDVGYAALVDAGAVSSAFGAASATPPIDATSPANVLRKFDVVAGPTPFWDYNALTGELYMSFFGEREVRVFAVPEPASLAALGGLMITFARRRRRAVAIAAVAGSASAANAAYVYDPLDFATEVVSSAGLPATALYNDPQAVLGRPTLKFNNGSSQNPQFRRAKLIEAAFNTGLSGERLITTLNAGNGTTTVNAEIVVKFGRPITDDPNNPFGLDFIVFGNPFYSAGGASVNESTNLNNVTLGNLSFERVKVSVSADGASWYRYEDGPYGDSAVPTNSYLWDRQNASWTDIEADPTLPVNPALVSSIPGMNAALALGNVYAGSAGGTGFDLAASGLASIQYIRVEGLTGFSGGEIDAFADVRPVPEPSALLALGGLGAILGLRRRSNV